MAFFQRSTTVINSIENNHSYAIIQNVPKNLNQRNVGRQVYIKENLEVHYLGAMDSRCNFCNAFYFQAEALKDDEIFTKCCMRRKYLFDFNFEIPNSIKMLICNANPESKNCCENITENSILL